MFLRDKWSRVSLTTRITSAVAVIGVVVVVVLTAKQVSGASSLGPIPSAKATIIAQSNHHTATSPRAPKSSTVTVPMIPGAATSSVIPTPQTGIAVVHQGPFANSTFSPMDQYIGPVNGQFEVVFAGTAWTNYEAKQGQGALRVYDNSAKLLGVYYAPDGSRWLQINSVQGTVLSLSSNKSALLQFNLATHAFV